MSKVNWYSVSDILVTGVCFTAKPFIPVGIAYKPGSPCWAPSKTGYPFIPELIDDVIDNCNDLPNQSFITPWFASLL